MKQAEAANSNTSYEALVDQYGEDRVKLDADGRHFTLKLDGKKELEEFEEMDRPRERAEVESSSQAHATTPMVTLRDREGRTMRVPEHQAEYVARTLERQGRHVHEVPYWVKGRRG